MAATPGISLPASMGEGAGERAVQSLRAYFAPLIGRDVGFTGSHFDSFDPSGTQASHADVFTADDIVAVSLLSVNVPGRATLELLRNQSCRFSALLQAVGPDRDLVDVESTAADRFPAQALSKALMALPGVGATTASKLMARKRPRLIPIFDTVINAHLLGGSGILWEPLRLSLRTDDRSLHHRLLHLRDMAGVPDHISAIRVLDVIAWMDGKGYTPTDQRR